MICTLQLNIDRALRSNRMKRAGHMAIVEERKVRTEFLSANLKERNYRDFQPADCKKILV